MRIIEVGPRDGLQNESQTLSVAQRSELVQKLLSSGLSHIEVGSFVKSASIPQLAETDKVAEQVVPYKKKNFPSATLWAFVPNERGLEEALRAQIDAVAFFSATSESFLKKNINRDFSQLRMLLKNLIPLLPKDFPRRIYLSTLVYCPFEGPISPDQVFEWVDFLLDAGFSEIALSDTTGHAHPTNLRPLFDRIAKSYAQESFSLHFHDTRGTALLNTQFAIDQGFTKFDSSVGGLGGCPYAPGALGNLATEDLLYLLHSEGLAREIDLPKIASTAHRLEDWLGKQLPSRVLKTFQRDGKINDSCSS